MQRRAADAASRLSPLAFERWKRVIRNLTSFRVLSYVLSKKIKAHFNASQLVLTEIKMENVMSHLDFKQ